MLAQPRTKVRTVGALLLLILGLFVALRLTADYVSAQPAGPRLAIADLSLPAGQPTVTIPVEFDPAGESIAALLFSLDVDPACLLLPLADDDGNGMPDSVSFSIPEALTASFSYSALDTDGEIDITVIDYSVPLTTISEGVLATLTFRIVCIPAPGDSSITTPVLFSTMPSPSYGDIDGKAVIGSWRSGSVTFTNPVTDTPTPTATATSTSTPTSTPSPTPTDVLSEIEGTPAWLPLIQHP
jgi:hypothetical protein